MADLSEEQKKRMMQAGQAMLNMSHGVKNILQTSRSGKDIMNEALKTGNLNLVRRTWMVLDQNLERIEKIILDTLKFSGDQPPQFEAFDINHLVESSVEAVRPRADRHGIKIITQLDKSFMSAAIDTEQIRDVILNLLINAIEAVQPKIGRIGVQTQLDSQQRQAILRIRDNGPGIDDTEKIFEPFYSTKSAVGTGLGLTIAKKIIDSHHGRIEVQSKAGEGATFTVKLPLDQNT